MNEAKKDDSELNNLVMQDDCELPKGWISFDAAGKFINANLMTTTPRFVLDNWTCKYINMRVDMRTGAVILSKGNLSA